MTNFNLFPFSLKDCEEELRDLGQLLESNLSLNEQQQVLPFFKTRCHLAVFLGSYASGIDNFDKYAFEYPLFQDFACDLVIGDSKSNQYVFIEFEDGKSNSIFVKNGKKSTLEWSPRFEHGYSQIIDWFWKIDDMRQTNDFRTRFGEIENYQGMLVIGRDSYLDEKEKLRLSWRRNNVIVASRSIVCITYDELYRQLNEKLFALKKFLFDYETTVKDE